MDCTCQEDALWKIQETKSQLEQLPGAVMSFDGACVIYLGECRRLQTLLWGVATWKIPSSSCLNLAPGSLRWRNHRISISVTCLNSSRIMRSPASQVSHQETEVMTNLRFLKREWLWGFPGAQLTWPVSLGFGCKFKKHKRQGWLLEPGPPLNSLPSQTLLLSTWFSFWSLSGVLLCYLGRQCKNESRITLIQNQVRCLSLPKSLSIMYQSKCLFLGMLVTKQHCKGTTCPNPWVFCFRQNPIWKTETALGL